MDLLSDHGAQPLEDGKSLIVREAFRQDRHLLVELASPANQAVVSMIAGWDPAGCRNNDFGMEFTELPKGMSGTILDQPVGYSENPNDFDRLENPSTPALSA